MLRSSPLRRTPTAEVFEPEIAPEDGCGWSWDHTVRELGPGHWECTECGAEGWDDHEEAPGE